MKKIILCLHTPSWVKPVSDYLKTFEKISSDSYELSLEDDVEDSIEKIPKRGSCMLIVSSDIPGANIPDLNDEQHSFLYLAKKAKEKNKCCIVIFYDFPPEKPLPKEYFDDVIDTSQKNSLFQIGNCIKSFLTKTPAE